jgi:hypothetical protein
MADAVLGKANASSPRARALVEQLREAADALIGVVEHIDPADWMRVPGPGVWSPGKDAEHVADGAALHQWLVRVTLGHKRLERPGFERDQLTALLSQRDVVELLRQRTEESASLVLGLTDEQLDLPVRPPQARPRTLARMIGERLIGHYRTHHQEIEAKLRLVRPGRS